MEVHVYIQNGDTVYEPAVIGDIAWQTDRKGQPGRMEFTALADGRLKIEEGNAVRLDINGKPVFFGFLFERSWGSDGQVKVTVYDQLRYLKNKDSYSYENLTAGEVVRRIAEDYHLQTGDMEDTGHVILMRNEKDKTLFDIILNALDLTMMATGKMFVLYDDAGKLALKNIEGMKLQLMIDENTAQDYDFKVSIDSNTYNQIKIYSDNQESGKRDVFLAMHTENINRWGVLQYDESLQEGADGQQAAETYLQLFNRPTRSLSIKDAFGDTAVRAGCLLPVFLDVKDLQLKNYLLVESVKHKISGGIHTMDLTLKGAGINA